jgi:hypothetical protein
LGRVDLAFLPGGDLVVSFLEQERLVLRRVMRDGGLGPLLDAAPTTPARANGFPRLIRAGGEVLLAWRDTSEPARIRTALVRSAAP